MNEFEAMTHEMPPDLKALQKSFARSFVDYALAESELEELGGNVLGRAKSGGEKEAAIANAEARLREVRDLHRGNRDALIAAGTRDEMQTIEDAKPFVMSELRLRISEDPSRVRKAVARNKFLRMLVLAMRL